jgi:hypothetical protein
VRVNGEYKIDITYGVSQCSCEGEREESEGEVELEGGIPEEENEEEGRRGGEREDNGEGEERVDDFRRWRHLVDESARGEQTTFPTYGFDPNDNKSEIRSKLSRATARCNGVCPYLESVRMKFNL